MARKRRFTTFSLSFLDIMSCGFGAAALVFLIIKHEVNTRVEDVNQELMAEVSLLDEDIRDGEAQLVRARNTVSELDQELATALGLARKINDDILARRNKISELDSNDIDQQILSLEDQLRTTQLEKERLEKEQQLRGNNNRRFVGKGERQYLTGLKLGGARILILVDASTSMLDETIVNIIRKRYMSDEVKLNSPKWLQVLKIVEWLTAQLPRESSYQIYTFSSEFSAAIPGTEATWLSVGDQERMEESILNLRKVIPAGGTNLENVFSSTSQFTVPPDNIYIITDGLPTLGPKPPRSGTITGKEREKLFYQALETLPYNAPVNVILLPLEGDPMAASAYWKLAQRSNGSFLTPSEDWP